MWPMKRDKCLKLLEDLGKLKSTVNLILTADTNDVLREVNEGTRQVKTKLDGVGEMISERFGKDEFRDIFAELVSVNPTNNHHQAWELHEPHTSEWLMRCPEWELWMDGNCRLLWIHGIPGAGKTILCSYVIETLKRHPQMVPQGVRSALAYYYCHHSRGHDSESVPFLAWILKQLCELSRFIPPVLKKKSSSMEELLQALDAICQIFDSVIIAIDALDECRKSKGLSGTFGQSHEKTLVQQLEAASHQQRRV
ncbi:hypothetical protein B0T22DRAFT_141108 [Podospora appendiculata]|uniref:Nephrocystin 3-like N-terminal domain-containing protein n=1 Tax=Podospora appendiculata TaxID=314037 RepID=A0AAE0X8T2_9PEZI|nr:hypothetical protein B0T22DRAFT_141108 [Podospora appendiculata]